MNSCQYCGKNDFANSHSLRQHEYRHRHKEERKSENIPQSVSIEPSDSEDIIERFQRGDIGEQSAVEEYEKQWVSQNPEPDLKHYREWSSRRAIAVDAFRLKLSQAKPRISQVQNAPVQRSLSISEIAEQRASQLRGEIPPDQAQSYSASAQTQSYSPQQPEQQTQQEIAQPQRPQIRLPTIADIQNWFKPKQKEKKFPDRPYFPNGEPASHYKCYTCWDWVSDSNVGICFALRHQVERVI